MSKKTIPKTFIMPKISQNLALSNREINVRESYLRKENLDSTKRYENNQEVLDSARKPGSSIDRKKPNNIFPKINQTKAPPSTANYIGSNKSISIYYDLSSKNEFYEEEKIKNYNKLSYNPAVYSTINEAETQSRININNCYNTNERVKIDLNKYKDISVNFLINNTELNQMFEKLYKNDNNAKKKWVELNLFGREVFKIRLESYIKNKMDIPSFIKNEIETLLSNKYCDYIFSHSCKQIESQCDEYMKNIDDIYK